MNCYFQKANARSRSRTFVLVQERSFSFKNARSRSRTLVLVQERSFSFKNARSRSRTLVLVQERSFKMDFGDNENPSRYFDKLITIMDGDY